MRDELVTVARYNQLNEAYLVKTRLESVGIECFIPDEIISSTHMQYLIGQAGVRLQVKGKDIFKALELLEKESSN